MHSNTNFLVETRKVNKKYIYKYVILAKAPCKEQFPVNLTQRRPEESVKAIGIPIIGSRQHQTHLLLKQIKNVTEPKWSKKSLTRNGDG